MSFIDEYQISVMSPIIEYIGGFVRLNIIVWKNKYYKNDFMLYKDGIFVKNCTNITYEYINANNILRMPAKSNKDISVYTISTTDNYEYEFVSSSTYISALRKQMDLIWAP